MSPPISGEMVKRVRESHKEPGSDFDSMPNSSLGNSSRIIERKDEEVKVLKEGIVRKKCGWIFYHNRKLVLTSQPRLSYYLPTTNQYKVTSI